MPKIPLRTRLPIQAWVLAGLITAFSAVTSLTHVPSQSVVYPGVSYAQHSPRGSY